MDSATNASSVFDLQTLLITSGMIVAICGVSFIVNTVFGRNDPPGRLWSAAFTAGILTTVSFAVWGATPAAWWAIAVGNGSLVLAMGCVWDGSRLFNGRSSRFLIVAVGAGLTGVAAAVQGPDGGDWAGGVVMLFGVALFATLAGIEALTGRMRRKLNARILASLMLIVGAYYATRGVVFIVASPESELFRDFFGTEVTTFVTILFVIVASTSMSILRADHVAADSRLEVEQIGWNGILPGPLFVSAAVDRVRRANRVGERTFFVGAEIDNLEDMNTAFGRSFGDGAIVSFMSILHDHLPATALLGDRQAGRFTAIIHAESLEQVHGILDDVRAALVESPIEPASGLRLSVSWGVIKLDGGEPDIEALTTEAHRLVRDARAAGGNRIKMQPVT
ncbi:diguanylate cyclase (GGDEF)-like protein [Mycetocola sp. CAN_C7]|uniref:GGDEF domain-containing protein n=1 Tax=Mycetocola sp. CAN_C7 TaxID=2787724 RepID=UPI0018CBDB61